MVTADIAEMQKREDSRTARARVEQQTVGPKGPEGADVNGRVTFPAGLLLSWGARPVPEPLLPAHSRWKTRDLGAKGSGRLNEKM